MTPADRARAYAQRIRDYADDLRWRATEQADGCRC